ncbi:hypothetical protein CKO42_13155 [Lamprobacter modestohalophilus]|uniref:Cation transporter n=1 Tax=Lamprobacter modestohalophilus TaxID=1064514 RepID=A0A9X0W9M2_9GAMM|nr:hypothetical protein [Lamprobacter modestohalophilus]
MIARPPIRNEQGARKGANSPALSARLLRFLPRLILFTALWLVIAGSDPSSWIIGLPTVLFATLSSLRLASAQPTQSALRLGGLLRFLPFFVVESIRGGIDVASRVLRPRVRINPGFQSYRPRLDHPGARVLFLDSISLLPGTLSADMRDGVIEVHALDIGSDLVPELQRLERLVGRVFGQTLEEDGA